MEIHYDYNSSRHTVSDLSITTLGHQDCSPSHFFGPAIRDYFLIHFVVSGSGIYKNQTGTYEIREGDIFLIRPAELTYYRADVSTPWTYYWVGFDGFKAKGLLSDSGFAPDRPVISPSSADRLAGVFMQMNSIAAARRSSELGCLGTLYLIFHLLASDNAPDAAAGDAKVGTREYFNKAILFFEQNYPYKIEIEKLSRNIGLDRTGLFRAFIRESGISPREYLIRFRIGKACELLHKTSLAVSEIAESVGMPNVSHFSDIFKSRKGLSPRVYRNTPPESAENDM
ncbi:MAG: AraC family ligand binding domain-containing protein [Saccharofermentanales bacterium]